jgi:hypothetical protein
LTRQAAPMFMPAHAALSAAVLIGSEMLHCLPHAARFAPEPAERD